MWASRRRRQRDLTMLYQRRPIGPKTDLHGRSFVLVGTLLGSGLLGMAQSAFCLGALVSLGHADRVDLDVGSRNA